MTNELILYNIYHYDDPASDVFYSYVSPEGSDFPALNTKWKWYGSFYGLSSEFYPVPSGFKLYSIEYHNKFPYGISDMSKPFDIFDRKGNNLYFNTYNMPAINTVILYSYKRDNQVYVTFSHIPPSFDKSWKIHLNLHVMTPTTIPNLAELKYNCINGRCTPWIVDVPGIYQQETSFTLTDTLKECVNTCNRVNASVKLVDEIQSDSRRIVRSLRDERYRAQSQDIPCVASTTPSWVVVVAWILAFIVLYLVYRRFRYHNKL